MVNYKDGKIYKIVCDETGLIYYGSTVQPLYKRLYKHKHKDHKNTCMTKDMINPKIYLVETFSCNTKEELLSRERYYIENNECCNKVVPLRTHKEYYEDHKEHIIQKTKEYYEDHKEQMIQYKKEYYLDNKEHLNQISKEWRDANKEYIIKKRKEWRAANKEQISQKKKKKCTCECGSVIRKDDIWRHRKSNKHQSYISNLS